MRRVNKKKQNTFPWALQIRICLTTQHENRKNNKIVKFGICNVKAYTLRENLVDGKIYKEEKNIILDQKRQMSIISKTLEDVFLSNICK